MTRLIPKLCILALSACTALAAFADGASYRLKVDGLACPFCAYGIEKQLLRIDGVQHLETHIREGIVVVTMTEGAMLDEATARQAVDDAGFTLDGFERASPSDDG